MKLQYPHFVDEQFVGLIDVVRHSFIRFGSEDDGHFSEEILPKELESKASDLREELIGQLAEVDASFSELLINVGLTDVPHSRTISQRCRSRRYFWRRCAVWSFRRRSLVSSI